MPLDRRRSQRRKCVSYLGQAWWAPYQPTTDRRVGWQITGDSLRRPLAGEDPSIFATALETLAVKAFGDMGQTARLRLIRDRFIAGHSSCELRRHLDSVPPETPMRDVVDRCRVWESHDDPAVRRVSKPSPDQIYVVGDSNSISETTWWQLSSAEVGSGSVRGLTPTVADGRRFPGSHTGSAPRQEIVTASSDRDTESAVAGRQSPGIGGIRADVAVVPLWTAANEADPSTATHLTGLERCGVFLMWEVGSCCDSLPKLE